MNQLLNLAVEAHGGLNRWNQLRTLKAKIAEGGIIWEMKGKADALKDVHVQARLHEQHFITDLPRWGRRFVFAPQRVEIFTESGVLEGSRDNPRKAFEGYHQDTPWDDLHVAYFNSYALWSYLTIPFLYTYPGFVCEELEPWQEDGETWRPLKVTFPDNIVSHTRQQVSYFGPDGLLRRHEYSVDVMGGARGLNYAYDYHGADGIVVPRKRRIYSADDQGRKVPEPLLISIDIKEITFA
jgi:hypothetical protein